MTGRVTNGYSNEPVDPAQLRAAFEELKARVETLEDELAAVRDRKLALGDLPLKSLQNHLEQRWHPNASVLLGPACITPEMIAR